MSAKAFRLITAAAAAGLLGVAPAAGTASAQPGLPPPPPWIPGAPLPVPGSFQYYYNVIAVPPPWTTVPDARGVKASTNADPGQTATGLPGSKLGNSPNKANLFTDANVRNEIAAGTTPATAPNPGVNVGAGQIAPTLEDPTGQPPKNTPGVESAAPTTAPGGPGVPAPVLEDPQGKPPAPPGG